MSKKSKRGRKIDLSALGFNKEDDFLPSAPAPRAPGAATARHTACARNASSDDAYSVTPDLAAPVDTPSMGTIGYHVRSGSHDVKNYDWEQYLKFADKHLKKEK